MHLKIRKFWILPWWSPVKPTDNVWNAGVVTDCWRFLSLVSICQLLLQSTQHERTFYNQFSLVCNQKKKKSSTIILFRVIVNIFSTILKTSCKCFEIDPRCHQTAGEIISYQIFLVPLLFCLISGVTRFVGGLLAPLCRPKTPDLSDQDTKITWPYLQVVYLTNLNR